MRTPRPLSATFGLELRTRCWCSAAKVTSLHRLRLRMLTPEWSVPLDGSSFFENLHGYSDLEAFSGRLQRNVHDRGLGYLGRNGEIWLPNIPFGGKNRVKGLRPNLTRTDASPSKCATKPYATQLNAISPASVECKSPCGSDGRSGHDTAFQHRPGTSKVRPSARDR
jgi:hypothetical protein